MKVRVIYHNKPHGVRIYNVHLAPVSRGVWILHADVKNWRGQEINSWGSDGDGDESVYFGDDMSHDRPEIRAQIRLTPERPSEWGPRLIDRMQKGTYEAVVMESKVWKRSWGRYLGDREDKMRLANKTRRKGKDT